ncbi:MAG: 1-deoxy-D-xylulose-5-phosphate reductoisomerase [Thermoguttaceae bacterium]|nr:1-deoxy-D-xylulose-5-phosphate reductoisomerase [Thermoguttaceae bacterium]
MSEFNANVPSENASAPRNVAVIGASGSIGTSALDVIAASGGRLRASVLSVNNDVAKLVELAKRFRPAAVVVANPNADRAPLAELPSGIEVLWGSDALAEVVRRPEIDVVLLAIVGVAGLRVAWSALEAGQTLALANKEALVAGGSLMTDLLRTNGGKIYPVDSEHSAIFQCLLSRRLDSNSTFVDGSDVERLILTASGGPFRDWSAERLKTATVADALKHPTWQMGAKITVDSASTMNKALEIIEARWLFGLDADKISVVVHPQSIVHSMVEFVDGAVLAQLSPPDMRLPIQLALYETERRPGPTRKFDWTQSSTLEFFPPDLERFPALSLGFEVAKKGGTAGVVLNAANEIAVDAFLNGRTTFDKIPVVCRQILENHTFEEKPTLERIVELDAWARKEAEIWISR